MSKRLSELASSLRQIGDIQVTDWDLKGLMNKDIKDLEISRTLRRLGNKKVIDWDFRTVMPAVQKLANQEVDLVGLMKRAARYKVMEWDFGSALSDKPEVPHTGPVEQEEVLDRLTGFLRFMAVNLTGRSERISIKRQYLEPDLVRFQLLVDPLDLKEMVGRNGATAAAIRGLFQASAAAHGFRALLQIEPHDQAPKA